MTCNCTFKEDPGKRLYHTHQTSDLIEKIPSEIASGAVHFTGKDFSFLDT